MTLRRLWSQIRVVVGLIDRTLIPVADALKAERAPDGNVPWPTLRLAAALRTSGKASE